MTLFSHPDTRLQDHLREVGKRSKEAVFDRSLKLSIVSAKNIAKVSYLIGIGHDFGKATTFFQNVIRGDKKSHPQQHHALISSLFTYHLVKRTLEAETLLPELSYLVVRYHHGNLKSPEEQLYKKGDIQKQWHNIQTENLEFLRRIFESLLESVRNEFSNLFESFGEFINSGLDQIHRDIDGAIFKLLKEHSEEQQIELYLLCNFLFSILVDSDKKSAAKLNTEPFEGACEPTLKVSEYLEYLRKNKPKKFDPREPLNRKRNAFFEQVTNHENLEPKNHLYTLTAPTGIGKTFAAYETASRLKSKLTGNRRIIYSLPFTSIIDQNYEELRQIMDWQSEFNPDHSKYLLKHHYLSTMAHDSETPSQLMNDPALYLREKMLNESWESGHIVTTFVQLFHSIIGNKNKFLKKFHNIVNSIVILDEVQNIEPDYYGVVRKVFSVLAQSFDTYFILMTATQPEIFSSDTAIELCEENNYFHNNLFNRVQVVVDDGIASKTLKEFGDQFVEVFDSQNALIVLNTKSCAVEFYDLIKKHPELERYSKFCLTTNLTPGDRLQKIDIIRDKLAEEEPIIVVSTQLIEAGVDLSFQKVWRDLGPFDSIVQVAGRCNRHGEMDNQGELRVISLVNEDHNNYEYASYIYSRSLLEASRKILTENEQIESSDFFELSRQYFQSLDYHLESKKLLKGLQNLNYTTERKNETSIDQFELIENLPYQEDIILCTKPEVQEKLEEYDEIYREFSKTDDYSTERDHLMGRAVLLKKQLADYTISVNRNHLENYLREKSDDVRQSVARDLWYVPFRHIDNVYSKNKGFMVEPDSRDLSKTAVF